ncbi:MAG TPA: C40 family peptidase, partial [Pyrinomonadaceae bacterium]|nr:C40 family peptidase [Pyrinomonadaceae bacterium]
CFTSSASAQSRDRLIKQTGSQPTNLPPSPIQQPATKPIPASRPVLTNEINVVKPEANSEPLVKRTGSSRAVNAPSAMAAAGRTAYGMSTSMRLDQAIKARYGTPYRYGSTGPNTYDCSGFVWSAFQEAGINFTRASARSLWAQSEPVYGDDRFKFGTLVFFNNLGHMGIVADENGFYQASSSKGVTYSPFAGYWQSRIVGYRRLKPEGAASTPADMKPVDDR